MALIDLYHAAVAESELRKRSVGGAIKAQADVRNEDPATPNHANRLIWADALVADPKVEGDKLWTIMLQDATVLDAVSNGTAVTDAQVQAVVNANIDTLATG